MPSLGADMEVGTIVEWRVRPGDAVQRGDIVAVVDTEKSDIEIEVFEDGVVGELLVEPGREVPVGTPLATIHPAGSAAATPAPPTATHGRGFVRASPLARREAAHRGIDLEQVAGRGPGGAVVLADVVDHQASRPGGGAATGDHVAPPPAGAPVPPGTPVPAGVARSTAAVPSGRVAARRRAIGTLMARSKREIPHYYLATTIDLGTAMAWLADTNARRSVTERLLPAALLLKAAAAAARQVPVVNGFWEEGFQPSPDVHLGVAVSLREGGLVAPAIHHADRLDLDDLMVALRDVVQRARAGALRSSEVADPTITVTNLGDQGVEDVFGVIYPPQVALVGVGTIVERPWASRGMLGVRPVVRVSLAADHRASDGHDGARYLAAVGRLLQTPEDL